MLESTVNARDSRFILVRALDRDRVTTLCPVGISLCVGLIVMMCTIVVCFGVPTTSLYIDREGRGAITILVGSTEGVLN